MPKKTTTLILILAVITALLVFLAIRETQPKSSTTAPVEKIAVPTKAVPKTAILSFTPSLLDLSTTSTPTPVDIIIDTGGSQVTGAQLEITFDPKAVTNLRISSPDNSLFGGKTDNIVLINDVNLSTGRVSFAVAATPGKSVKGVGKIATLTIQKAFGTDINTSQIVFLDKTMVVMPGTNDSILKSSTPLTIQLLPGKSPSPSIQQLVPVVSPTVTR